MDLIPIWLFLILSAIIAGGFIQVGYYWSKNTKRANSSSDAAVGSIVGSTLALLAFMLAFTFQIASARFDARRVLVVKDANVIGTCYLRAGYLTEPHKATVRKILKDYVSLRVRANTRLQMCKDVLQSTDELQNKLWNEAEAIALAHPNLPSYALFISSVNDVIDTHAERVAAVIDARVPLSIWLVMFVVGALAMIGTGYFCGLSGRRNSPECVLLVLAFSLVFMLVVDLDRPWEGSIATPQTPMLKLARQIGAD